MEEKVPKEQQQRNDAYNEYVKKVTPTRNLWIAMGKAFLLGGVICLIGQVIVEIGMNQFGLEQTPSAPSRQPSIRLYQSPMRHKRLAYSSVISPSPSGPTLRR